LDAAAAVVVAALAAPPPGLVVAFVANTYFRWPARCLCSPTHSLQPLSSASTVVRTNMTTHGAATPLTVCVAPGSIAVRLCATPSSILLDLLVAFLAS